MAFSRVSVALAIAAATGCRGSGTSLAHDDPHANPKRMVDTGEVRQQPCASDSRGQAVGGLLSVSMLKKHGGRVDWSPSGNDLIAFDSKGADGYYDVYVTRPDGSGERCITCNQTALPGRHMGNPAWHPSGRWIVFQAEKKAHPGGSFGASPGLGKYGDLWLASADATKFYQLTDQPNNGGVLHPHFSKDGRKLSWSEMVGEPRLFKRKGSFGIWTLKVADFALERDGPTLTNIREYQPGGPAFYENHGFSPNGTKLLFTSNYRGGPALRGNKVYSLDLSTNRLMVLTDNDAYNEHAAFSPDGTRIIWGTSLGNANRGMDWWIMDSDGANKARASFFNQCSSDLFPRFVLAVDVSWSPSGDRVVGYIQDSMVLQTGSIVIGTLTKH